MGWDWCAAAGADHCVGGPRPGARSLEAALLAIYGPYGAGSLGIYSCRRVGPGGSWSIHAAGRALDLSVPLPPSTLGAGILAAIGRQAQALGIQRVIYNERIYDTSSPAGEPYHGVSPHHDHLHIELTPVSGETLSYSHAFSLLDGTEEEEGEAVVMLGRVPPGDQSTRWLLSGGKRIYLENQQNVAALLAAGLPVIRLTDALLARLPEVR